tara:strand:- start:13167 stop:13724 length:558 start_codon:yes stop_codon:yes gene_type:complete
MKEDHKDPLPAILDYGIDIAQRRIFLHGDVDEDTIAYATRGLLHMADMSDAPVTLMISSYGGNIDESFVLHDVMKAVACPIHTVALGFCMSAAPFLVAAGDVRMASANTDFMMHTASFEMEGSMANAAATTEAVRARCERMDRLMAKYSTQRYAFWKKFTDSPVDVYFDAMQAIEWGLVDSIWMP